MLERQIRELCIYKESCSNKSQLSKLFWNRLVMHFDIYLDGFFVFFVFFGTKKKVCVLATLLQR